MRAKWVIVIAALCLLVAVAAVAWAAGQAKVSAPEVIQAQRFELVDPEGEVRAELGLMFTDKPTLTLSDEKGNVVAMLAVCFDGTPGLALVDKKGTLRVGLSLLLDGSPSLTFYDEKGKPRAVLGTTQVEATRTGAVDKRPESSLVLFDKDGKVLWEAP